MDFAALSHHPFQFLSWALTWVRDATMGDNLRQQDPERPHVRLDGEGPIVNGFWCCPLNGKLGPWWEAERGHLGLLGQTL